MQVWRTEDVASLFRSEALQALKAAGLPHRNVDIASLIDESPQGFSDVLHGHRGSLDRIARWVTSWNRRASRDARIAPLELLIAADGVHLATSSRVYDVSHSFLHIVPSTWWSEARLVATAYDCSARQPYRGERTVHFVAVRPIDHPMSATEVGNLRADFSLRMDALEGAMRSGDQEGR